MSPLERLETLDPRTHWPDEAADFTPWVSSQEGLRLIGETLNLKLETLSSSSEVPVGRFRADVVCVDTSNPDDSLVLIENQLDPTNHEHVGQVLTYAAGLDAVTIIWIASEFREEHTAVIEWLNRITDERYRFFGLEIGLVKIGESDPAATYSVAAKPNNWTRGVRQRTESERSTNETRNLHRKFWTALFAQDPKLDSRIPQPQRWFDIGIGARHGHISAVRAVQSRTIQVGLVLPSDMRNHYMLALLSQKGDIEKELGIEAEFVRREKTNSVVVTEAKDLRDETDWPAQIAWFSDMIARFERVFRPRMQAIDPEEWEDEVQQLEAEEA